MSEAGTAISHAPAGQDAGRQGVPHRVAELKVSGHLMTLETGLFCVFQAPGPPAANDRSGLPGVRISLPPGPAGRPEAVSISTFRDDGWMNGSDTAALIRVANGPAQVLVTVYQAPTAPPEAAPRLQVMRLGAEPPPTVGVAGRSGPSAGATGENADVTVHVQRTGDLAAKIGEWAGARGSRQWIEGFSLTPHDGISVADIEYQAVLGRGWLSPWIEGGKFCGSRGMALPLLGLKVRLKGNAAKTHECSYSATFVDGSSVGPIPGGATCEAESLAALEAFQLVIRRRGRTARPRKAAARTTKPVRRAADLTPPKSDPRPRPTARRSR
jgi:hypothetical protein